MYAYLLKSLKNKPSVFKTSLSTLKQDNSFYLVIFVRIHHNPHSPTHTHRYCNIDKAQSRAVCKEQLPPKLNGSPSRWASRLISDSASDICLTETAPASS